MAVPNSEAVRPKLVFPVGSLFRLRVSHHLGRATFFPAPASSNAACGFAALRSPVSLRLARHTPRRLRIRIRIDIDNPSHELVPGLPADAKIPVRAPGQS